MHFHITEYSASQRKQYINSKQLYEYYIQKKKTYYMDYHVSMYWKKAGGREYLTKKHSASGKVTSLGAKNDKTIKIYEEFKTHKQKLKRELATIEERLDKNKKLNKIELINRVPGTIVHIFQKINELGLDRKILLIGTNALYAYEAYFGVFIEEEQLATDDIDLLNKQQKSLSLIFQEVLPQPQLKELIRFIDKSFEQDAKAPYRFINKEGVLLDIITPVQEKNGISRKREKEIFPDIIPLTMHGMQWLENAPLFQSFVIGEDGKGAVISTIPALEYAVYKNWLSQQSDREIIKRQRDLQQSILVTQLIQEYMVHIDIITQLKQMIHFKKEVINDYRKMLDKM